MKIAVVILNWNGKNLLKKFLPSIISHSSEANIYVADNASSDDSVAFVSEFFPSIQIIRNAENGGFSKGYNDALSNLDEDLFILLNSDVEVSPNWLAPIVVAFSNNKNIVAAQPRILDFNKRDTFEYAGAAGGFMDSLGYPYCRGRIFNSIEQDNGQYSSQSKIFWASGACMVVRKDAFWEAGGLDEDFFAHQEEIDLCWRLQSKGGSIHYIAESKVYHVGGATLKASNPKKTFYNFRNTLLVLLKNVKGSKVWWLIIQRLILDGLAGANFLLQGKIFHFVAIVKAHFSFYVLIPRFLGKRKVYASTIKYYNTKSIVWNYFVLKKRNFNQGY